ncbi:signal peptidase II [Georgenia yuyongxinii]
MTSSACSFYNPGAAFSLATGMTWVFTIVSVVVVVVVVRIARRLGSAWWAVALGMLLGGSLGNLYDRLFRDPGFAEGHVVDFISYGGYFIGNVADIAIVGAAILIGLLAVRGREVNGSLAAHRHATAAQGGSADGAEAGTTDGAQGGTADGAQGGTADGAEAGTADGAEAGAGRGTHDA